MKKLKMKIVTLLASIAILFGIQATPVFAFAEETMETPEIVTELPENQEDSEVIEETPDNTQEPTTEEEKKPTFEDILAAVQQEAERYGYGNDYAAAMEAIKTAATTKQVTISTVFSAMVALSVIGHIIYSKIKDKTLKSEIKKLLSYIENQSNGINGLIDGTNENGKVEADTHKIAELSHEELQHIGKGLVYLTTAFMAFSEGHKYQETKKTQVEMNCVKALKEVEKSEVIANENKA